jgi:N-acetyl-beta-hexosaminidase
MDVPGHARAAIKAMSSKYPRGVAMSLEETGDMSLYNSVQGFTDNVLNPSVEFTYYFLSQVLAEWRSLFKYSSVIHMGYDELPDGAWAKSPGCLKLAEELRGKKGQAVDEAAERETKEAKEAREAKQVKQGVVLVNEYFKQRVHALLTEMAPPVRMGGWEEIALLSPFYVEDNSSANQGGGAGGAGDDGGADHSGIDTQFAGTVDVYAWNGVGLLHKLANSGHRVIACNASQVTK